MISFTKLRCQLSQFHFKDGTSMLCWSTRVVMTELKMQEFILYAIAAIFVLIVMALYLRGRRRHHQSSAFILSQAVADGLIEPASLHPVVDLGICVGSGACVKACPEKAMGVIDGKGVVISPSACIGHGACAAACPLGSIKLVFGTARRGMDIPKVKRNFESNVAGIFIAGELGGMGLIRKAVEQGKQAMSHIAKRCKSNPGNAEYQVLIVGAGPAGISATLAAKQSGLHYLTIEQEESLGGSSLHYPRNKIVMTAPMDLPVIGKVSFREISKESLIEFWHNAVEKSSIEISFGERFERLEHEPGMFRIFTNKRSFTASHILLGIGRRGTPRRLGVPGEDRSKVVYRLIEPEQFRGGNVLVVGGGDSAIESALVLADEAGTGVTLSYRGTSFSRVKPENRERLDAAERANKIRVMLGSEIVEIGTDNVTIRVADRLIEMPNEAVFVCAGGILPSSFLTQIGIEVETHHGAEAVWSSSMGK